MSTQPKVTIITATTGASYLMQNLKSVQAQTYGNIQHLVVIDGSNHLSKVTELIDSLNASKTNKNPQIEIDFVVLPYPTGIDKYNGHKIYSCFTYLAKGDYICFLDEDNYLEPDHIESLVNISNPEAWSCSLRKVIDANDNFICNDDCESLGNWKSILGDYFVDVNCFFLPKHLAITVSPLWYRRARHPDDQPEVDRALTHVLKEWKLECKVTGKYTLNYREGNRNDSVAKDFFIAGNEKMRIEYNGVFPWSSPPTPKLYSEVQGNILLVGMK
jgi:glycosyltransferase involved in cell wall biosynthesis